MRGMTTNADGNNGDANTLMVGTKATVAPHQRPGGHLGSISGAEGDSGREGIVQPIAPGALAPHNPNW